MFFRQICWKKNRMKVLFFFFFLLILENFESYVSTVVDLINVFSYISTLKFKYSVKTLRTIVFHSRCTFEKKCFNMKIFKKNSCQKTINQRISVQKQKVASSLEIVKEYQKCCQDCRSFEFLQVASEIRKCSVRKVF